MRSIANLYYNFTLFSLGMSMHIADSSKIFFLQPLGKRVSGLAVSAFEQLNLAVDARRALGNGELPVNTLANLVTRLHIVFQLDIDQIVDFAFQVGIKNRNGNFYPPFRVARHKISGGDIDLLALLRPKQVNTRMLKIASDDTGNIDVTRFTGGLHIEAANTADNHPDF